MNCVVRTSLKISICILLVMTGGVALAQLPSIPDGPDGTLFTCAQAEDDLGCYGNLLDANSESIGFRRAKRTIRRNLRLTKRERRDARRIGDFDSVDVYTAEITLLKSIRRAARQCFRYDDPDCTDSGSGGEEGGGKSGETGGGNTSVTEACNALGNTSSDRHYIRIVNGAVCTRGDSPIVPIYNNGSQHCTGSVIAANVVVTAAHCVVDTNCGNLTVTTGSGLSRSVQSCPSHPSYDGYSEDNDVALLILSGDLDSSTITLHTTADVQVGEQVAFAGYGRNEEDDENLRATFNTLTDVSTGSLVVEYTQGNSSIGNSCNGDSGGPLAVQRNGEWVLIGAVSNGDAQNCALPGYESSDVSRWANLTSSSNLQFIADNTSGIVD